MLKKSSLAPITEMLILSFLYFSDLLPRISGETLQLISLSLIKASASEIDRGAALIFWLPLPRDG